MTGKDIARMALELVSPPRVPVTLIAGGEWYVHSAGRAENKIFVLLSVLLPKN